MYSSLFQPKSCFLRDSTKHAKAKTQSIRFQMTTFTFNDGNILTKANESKEIRARQKEKGNFIPHFTDYKTV